MVEWAESENTVRIPKVRTLNHERLGDGSDNSVKLC